MTRTQQGQGCNLGQLQFLFEDAEEDDDEEEQEPEWKGGCLRFTVTQSSP